MDDSQATRFSLIMRLRDSKDSQAWTEFVDIYSPAVYGYARRFGLQDADAADVTQEVFRTVARSLANFQCDAERGSFRAWLMTVVRSRLNDFWSAGQRQTAGSGDTGVQRQLEGLPDANHCGNLWQQEYEKSVFAWAAEKVRKSVAPTTWSAFWDTSVTGKSVRDVASSLGISEGAVYIAKCRVLAKVKEEIAQVEESI